MPGNRRLDDTLAALLARRKTRNQFRRLTTVPPGSADFSSNAYLSLSSHPQVQRAFLDLLQQHATHSTATTQTTSPTQPTTTRNGPRSTSTTGGPGLLGSGGSRLLDGNSPFTERLEQQIAAFHDAASGLLFNSAMDANVGLFSCVPQPGDAVVYDELIHASVHDGMRLSRIPPERRIPFAHNLIYDTPSPSTPPSSTPSAPSSKPTPTSLESALRHLCQSDPSYHTGTKNVFIAVEGVYSMDGDVCPVLSLCTLVDTLLPHGNGHIIVDEAHSVGIFGGGRGLVAHLNLQTRIFARVLGFGKAMSCSGGMILCSPVVRQYLINYARTLIYTTSMPFPNLAAIQVAYDFLSSPSVAAPLLTNLWAHTRHAHALLTTLVSRQRPPPEILSVNTREPESPVIPVFTSHPRSLAAHCQKNGYMVRPIVAPTVPRGKERVRVCLHAGNTTSEIEGLVKAMEDWVVSSQKGKEQTDVIPVEKAKL